MRREVVLWLTVLTAIMGQAQEVPVVIKRLEITLWPEYDDPRLLVIYRGELAEDPKGPLMFIIPATAQIHATAHRGPDGGLLADDWQILPANTDQQLVLFTPGSRWFQLEYYDDVIVVGPEKSFVFQFQSSRYEVNELEFEVQQPLRARGLEGIPTLEAQGADAQGLSYFGRKVGAVSPGTLIEQRISYTKGDGEPSLRASEGSNSAWLIVGALAVLTIGIAGLVWLWWDRRRSALPPKSLMKQRSSRFCARCGYQFHINEHFCPQCGQPR